MSETSVSPAETLRAAAERLRRAADAAWDDLQKNPFWEPYDPITVWRDGLVNALGGPAAGLAALFPPDVAAGLAGWLEFEADMIERLPGAEYGPRTERALGVARAVLGEEARR